MNHYIQQLIEDLGEAAKNPSSIPFIEVPPHLNSLPDVAELALVPFKPISEWIGIEAFVFPDMIRLTGPQCEEINKAIFKLFEAFHIELIDAPEDIPREVLYDVIITNWDYPVQYLPSSGFDLELCTGNSFTCPYGDYCDCDKEDDFDGRNI